MFKSSFKYYKRKCPAPDLSFVLDFKNENTLSDKVSLKPLRNTLEECEKTLERVGLLPVSQWKIYELKNHPGLIVVSGALSLIGQKYWAGKCLLSYPKSPNRSNLPEDDLNLFSENIIAESKLPHEKLRWVTMGYHHNWDTKVYSDEAKSCMPEEVVELCRCVSGAVLNNWDYKAQAVIVNYYYSSSTLSGHTDHSELIQTAPIISLSIGQNAIFLIGGKSVDDSATALLIRSGDIVIMSGESRLSYHGVPRIFPAENISSSSGHAGGSNDVIDTCLNRCRININARQVLPDGQNSLQSCSMESNSNSEKAYTIHDKIHSK